MTRQIQHAPNECYRQGALASVLMFVAGSVFSLGVFIPSVERAAQPPHSLNGVWESAMGAAHFLSGPVMIVAGMFLDADKNQVLGFRLPQWSLAKTNRVRMLSLVSLLSFFGFAMAAHGAIYSWGATLFVGVLVQGFPLAVAYLVCMELLLAWFPHNSGPAVASGQFAFGIGTVLLTQFFSVLITEVRHVGAIIIASLTLTAGAILPTLFMRWPSEDDTITQSEEQPLLDNEVREPKKIPWPTLIGLRNFWFYLFTVFTTSVGYFLNPFYFKLGGLFNASFERLVLVFNATTLIAVFCGLVCTSLTNKMRFGSGFWFSGAKNLMIIYMIVQILLMRSMIFVNNHVSFLGFAVVKALMKVIMECHVGCAAILARDLYGSKNSAIVFGFGAGLALGGGEAISAWVMTGVESRIGVPTSPSDYNLFYWIATVWSLVGMACLLSTRRHPDVEEAEPIL